MTKPMESQRERWERLILGGMQMSSTKFVQFENLNSL